MDRNMAGGGGRRAVAALAASPLWHLARLAAALRCCPRHLPLPLMPLQRVEGQARPLRCLPHRRPGCSTTCGRCPAAAGTTAELHSDGRCCWGSRAPGRRFRAGLLAVVFPDARGSAWVGCSVWAVRQW